MKLNIIKKLLALSITLAMITSINQIVFAGEFAGYFNLTAYCPCYSCSEGYGHSTASGAYATEGITVAASSAFPLGTIIYIDGIGYRTVQDRGGGVTGNMIDIFVEEHYKCYNDLFNRKQVKVWIKVD